MKKAAPKKAVPKKVQSDRALRDLQADVAFLKDKDVNTNKLLVMMGCGVSKHLDEIRARLDKLDDAKQAPTPVAPSDGDWTPKVGDYVWVVTGDGDATLRLRWVSNSDYLRYHNVFRTEAESKKAAAMKKRSNAIIRACLLVDPDFVPDWSDGGQKKHGVSYSHAGKRWDTTCVYYCDYGVAHVSTQEKAQQVRALLTKWGIE